MNDHTRGVELFDLSEVLQLLLVLDGSGDCTRVGLA